MYLAACDLGSNTFLLTVAILKEENLVIVEDRCNIVRLKAGSKKQGQLSKVALERATKVLAEYKEILAKYKINGTRMRAVTTSALRDVKGAHGRQQQKSVLERFSQTLGYPIKIISGKEEGELSYLGAVMGSKPLTAYDKKIFWYKKKSNPSPMNLVIDIGGGSTEVSLGIERKLTLTQSLDIGIIDWTEKYFSNFPPTPPQIAKVRADLQKHFTQHLVPFLEKIIHNYSSHFKLNDVRLFGIAGVPVTLGVMKKKLSSYHQSKLQNLTIGLNFIEKISRKLLAFDLEELISVRGIDPRRSDLMPMGTLILAEAMHFFGINKINISTYGLRVGMLALMVKKYQEIFPYKIIYSNRALSIDFA